MLSTDPRHTLTLEIDRAEPVTGRLREGEGTTEEFVGWLGLAKALERALGLAAPLESRGSEASGTDPGP
jgi:hypothetical protein